MSQRKFSKADFLSALFNPDELVNFSDHVYDKDTKGRPIATVENKPRAQFFTLNPILKDKGRADSNVSALRNFLFEIDVIPLEEQIPVFKSIKFPFTTCVYSGGKSYHFILALDDTLESRADYDALWKALASVIEKHGGPVDVKCKNPSRLSRLGDGKRDNGKLQEIKAVGKRISFAVVDEWLKGHGVDWWDYLPDFTTQNSTTYSAADVQEKFDWVIKGMKNLDYTKGNRNHYQFVLARKLKNTGLELATVTDLIYKHCKEFIDNGAPIKSAFDTKYKTDPAIYVPTKEERIAYYQQKEAKQIEEETKARYSSPALDLDPELNQESINRYLRVGTTYYKKDYERNVLIPWTASIFEKDYGKKAFPPKCYDDFFYEPDYISETPPIEAGKYNQYRNCFQKPNWKVEPGEFPTIKQGLTHGFGDQYELILKYCAVSIIWPKQKLPAIVLVGEEDSGKSAIIKIFVNLVGVTNTRSIKNKDFESDFNSFLENSQLIIIEEAGIWKDPNDVASQFKRLITETDPIMVNRKHAVQYSTHFHGKFILASNDLSPLKMKGASTRFWVREITQKPQMIENYYEKIEKEMGHFVWHLVNEVGPTLEYPRKPRLYFDPVEFETEAKKFMKEYNKGEVYEKIKDVFEDWFEMYGLDEINFDLGSLKELVDFETVGDKRIKEVLALEFGCKARTGNILKDDSLRFQPEVVLSVFEIDSRPKRKARWFVLTKEKFEQLKQK